MATHRAADFPNEHHNKLIAISRRFYERVRADWIPIDKAKTKRSLDRYISEICVRVNAIKTARSGTELRLLTRQREKTIEIVRAGKFIYRADTFSVRWYVCMCTRRVLASKIYAPRQISRSRSREFANSLIFKAVSLRLPKRILLARNTNIYDRKIP